MSSTFSSEKLTELRKLKGYSQEKLAERAGINIRTLQRLEKTDVNPQPHTLKILADALEVTIDDFMVAPIEDMPTQMPALLHFSGLAGTIIPLGNVFVPFLFWLYKKKQFPELDTHVKQVVNFHLSITVYVYATLLVFFTVEQLSGILILTILLGFSIIVFPILNGFRVLKKRPTFYPFSIKFWK